MDYYLVANQRLDNTEEVEVILKPLDEVIEMLNNNKFIQALNISPLYYAIRYLENIEKSNS